MPSKTRHEPDDHLDWQETLAGKAAERRLTVEKQAAEERRKTLEKQAELALQLLPSYRPAPAKRKPGF